MARWDNFVAANRFAGLGHSHWFTSEWETQAGIPVDGSNARLRDLSPFTFRLLPPDALLESAAAVEANVNLGANTNGQDTSTLLAAQARSVDLITQAASYANNNARAKTLRSSLSQVTLLGTDNSVLRSALDSGVLSAAQGSGYHSTIVNAATAADITLQLDAILNAPPLTLLVNPTSISLQYSKIQSYQTRTRYGFVFEPWGEDTVKLTISASTGSFLAGASSRAGSDLVQSLRTSSVSGLHHTSKRDSAAWQNFMNLMGFYRNNGYIYDTVGRSHAHLFIGAVAIDYDQWTYVGHIDSLEYSEEEDKPHNVTFNLEFVATRIYDWATQTLTVLPLNSTGPTESAVPSTSSAGESEEEASFPFALFPG